MLPSVVREVSNDNKNNISKDPSSPTSIDKRKRADSHSQREREQREENNQKQFNTINATNTGGTSQLSNTQPINTGYQTINNS